MSKANVKIDLKLETCSVKGTAQIYMRVDGPNLYIVQEDQLLKDETLFYKCIGHPKRSIHHQ